MSRNISIKPQHRIVRAPVVQDCRHHWLLGEVTGPESLGVCKLCGAQKVYKNWPAYDALPPDWNRWYGGDR